MSVIDYMGVAIILTAIGYFCLGRSWEMRKVTFWRIAWVELEHALAFKENREPRDIEVFEKEYKNK
jgi:hypothetical protein